MTMENKCLTIGEAMIEFVPNQNDETSGDLKDAETFKRDASGSPAIIAAVVSLLGQKSAMIGKIGEDAFGDYLCKTLSEYGVDTTHFKKTSQAKTAISFSMINGEKGQSVNYRDSSADTLLKPDDISNKWFENGDIFYYGSTSLIKNPSRGAVEKALNFAGKKGNIIVFAPQLACHYWPNGKMARETVYHAIPHAHLLILTERELKFLADQEDEYDAIKKLFVGKTKLMVIHREDQSLTYVTGRERGHLGSRLEQPIDVRGMEEAFVGCLIAEFLKRGIHYETLNNILNDRQQLEDMLTAALDFKVKVGKESGGLNAIAKLKFG